MYVRVPAHLYQYAPRRQDKASNLTNEYERKRLMKRQSLDDPAGCPVGASGSEVAVACSGFSSGSLPSWCVVADFVVFFLLFVALIFLLINIVKYRCEFCDSLLFSLGFVVVLLSFRVCIYCHVCSCFSVVLTMLQVCFDACPLHNY